MLIPFLLMLAGQAPELPKPSPGLVIHELRAFSEPRDLDVHLSTSTDLDGDGIVDPLIGGDGTTILHGGPLDIQSWQRRREHSDLGPSGRRVAISGLMTPLKMGAQIGILASVLHFKGSFFVDRRTSLVVWDAETQSTISIWNGWRETPFAEPEPLFSRFVPQGDLDGDGFDEVLVSYTTFDHLSESRMMLLDSATGNPRWITPYESGTQKLASGIVDSGQDLDGDGCRDILLARKLPGTPENWVLQCRSGRDGRSIWRVPLILGQALSSQSSISIVEDLDGDGFRDLFLTRSSSGLIQDPGNLMAISGQNGELIWQRSVASIDPYYLPGFQSGISQLWSPVHWPDQDQDGIPDLAARVLFQFSTGQYDWFEKENIWVFSGKNGEVLQRHPFVPMDNSPWNATAREFRVWDLRSGDNPMDVDGDGYPEWGFATEKRGQPNQGDTLLFLGIPTLRLPGSVRTGEPIPFAIDLPRAAGREYRILASAGFRPGKACLKAGPWKTFLKEDAILRASLGTPSLQGNLDAFGQARGHFSMPSSPWLHGRTLYFSGFALDAFGPGGIFAKSTVAEVKFLP